jgi:uncharacterized protein DUF4430
MAVTLEISGSPAPVPQVIVPWSSGMNVQQLLEAAYNQVGDASKFAYELQFFGSYQPQPLGYMVTMVDGVSDLPGEGVYWALLVNGNYSQFGIDLTILQDGDVVSLSNESYQPALHQGTHLQAKHDTLRAATGKTP